MREKYEGLDVVYKFVLNNKHRIDKLTISIGEEDMCVPSEYNVNVNIWFTAAWGEDFESFTPYIYDTFADAERFSKKLVKRIYEETGYKDSKYEGLENC